VLQFACLILAAGVLWLRHTILAHGLHADSLLLVAPQLVVGIGMGMMISPLFDFTLASVTDTEVGSASGVLNAIQQLGGAIGVAGIGTLFFSTLEHSGYVTALSHSLLVELATTPVLLLLVSMLPSRAREAELAPDDGAPPQNAAPMELDVAQAPS
jgi:MFS family permease